MINTKTHFHEDKKLFELFCIENDFAKYFAKFHKLPIITTGQIKIPCAA